MITLYQLRHHLVNRCHLRAFEKAHHLTNLQLPLIQVTLEDTSLGTSFAEQFAQCLNRSTSQLSLRHKGQNLTDIVTELVLHQACRGQLLEQQLGISLLQLQTTLLKGLMS